MIPKFLSILLLTTTLTQAENWPGLRGPNQDGSSTETGLPTKFSKTENVKWSVDLPGPSGATPTIWGDHVFVSSANESTKKLHAMCFDRKTGKLLWDKQVADGFKQDDRSNLAGPSPTTDGKHVYFFYGTTDLVAFDFEGNQVWQRNIQKDYGSFAFLWTFSTSPLVHDGILYMQVLQRDVSFKAWGREVGRPDGKNDSYLLALDPASGKELWKASRPSEAKAESLEAFTTPVIHKNQLLITGGDCITGHNPKTGKELWRWGTWNPERIGHWRLVPSPVAGGGVALACAPKKNPIYAVSLGNAKLMWSSEDKEVSSDVSTPAFYKGDFYIINSDRKSLCSVAPDGTVHYAERIEDCNSKIEASPTVADGKIYAINHSGQAFVWATGPDYKLLHQTNMGEGKDGEIRSSIAVSGSNLFIRTDKKLFCIGN
ncbi:MAG: outer membrane protein assembly factor BamB [Pseudoalteromonas tetraodonis]|jgi:outer membrane protein assembly factor BamB